MDFFKALIPGTLLTFVVAGIMGSNQSKGGWLNISHVEIEFQAEIYSYYWSWPLFAVATGLAWVLFAITPD